MTTMSGHNSQHGRHTGDTTRDQDIEHREDTLPDTDIRDSNPNAAGPHGLAGDMGVSSERSGPQGDSRAAESGIEGTGSHGSAASATDGVFDSTPVGGDEPGGDVPRVHPQQPAEGADEDDDSPDQERTSTEDPAEGFSPASGVDRTVGEPKPAPVANKHQFDPSRNPGHSGG